ncbi:hypothetical protein ASG11_09850 [Sphingomonas sp. Leaf357]|uniref:hypothetical protein n=1 Tax=Sphingomonas sp. Leaf357 TaxID=1736350 RepID=UPI0006F995AE|nr:hypothetical protein [Sphingomonas sp. Leaf357]KQS04513.1 hypothetical protein ASG11_09850 [Sphingomonas sp. Leaf357]
MDGFNSADLFGTVTHPENVTYPDQPGFKGEAETGREAAAAIAPHLGRLQRIVLGVVTDRGALGVTPEEAGEVLDMARVSVQPRFSELKAKGQVVDSGIRRINASSRKRAVVYVLPQYAPAEEGEKACG